MLYNETDLITRRYYIIIAVYFLNKGLKYFPF